jgi:hypothetical protein
MSVLSYFLTYFLGGLTFIPLLLAIVFGHAYLTQPVVRNDTSDRGDSEGSEQDNGRWQDKEELAALPPELVGRVHEPDVAAGYFTVAREFIPVTAIGKTPDRLSSASSTTSNETPSVYQSMYRSIFERGKQHGPSLDAGSKGPKNLKRTNNVFFVVLRYVDALELETIGHGKLTYGY